MRASAIKDLAILSIREGNRLGRVRDLLFDRSARRIAALVVDPAGSGMFDRANREYVLFSAVQSIGDAVTVGSGEAILHDGEVDTLRGLPSLDRLHGAKVVDTTGKLLGAVQEVEIDPADGSLAALHVHQGGVLGLGGEDHEVPASAVHSLGDDAIMVEPLSATR
jgi:sporulation protein YlmC with PRC-barrel domain